MKRFLALIILAVVLFGGAAIFMVTKENTLRSLDNGLKNAGKSPLNLYFIHWGNFPREMLNQYTLEHPGVQIVFERFPEDYYPVIQKIRISSGDEVDVMGITRNSYKDFMYRGYLLDLSGREYLNNFVPEAREEIKKMHTAGREYAIAYRSYVFGIWYNKILFSKFNLPVPQNYSQFLEVCRKLKANGVAPLVFGARDDWSAGYIFLPGFSNIISDNGKWVDDLNGGKASWTDRETADAMNDAEALIAVGYVANDSIKLTYHQAFSEFTRGHAAMTIMGDWSLNLVKGDMGKVCDPGVFPIPYENTDITGKVPGVRADLLTGIFSESKHPQEAESFLEYLSSVKAAQIFSDTTMSVSTVKGVKMDGIQFNSAWEPLRKMELIPIVFDEMKDDVRKYLYENAKELFIGSKSSGEILEELQVLQSK